MKALDFVKNNFKSWLLAGTGSFLVIAGWNWYHLNKHNHLRFVLISLGMWAILFLAWYAFKRVYRYLIRRVRRHPYWSKEFYDSLDLLYFASSFLFLLFFSRNELLTLGYVSLVFIVIYYLTRYVLKKNPAGEHWIKINDNLFLLAYFIFLVIGGLQYLSYYYYIFDPTALIFNIVTFRAWSLTAFWMSAFALAGLLSLTLKKFWRWLPFGIWFLAFVVYLIFWAVNAGILYFSGLYLSPTIMDHAKGSSGVVLNSVSYLLMGGLLALLIGAFFVVRKVLYVHHASPKRYWYYYHGAILLLGVATFLGVASFWNTPEAMVAKSFIDDWKGNTEQVTLDPVVQKKLEKFGLFYNTQNFEVARHDHVYESQKVLLPKELASKRPNVVIVFLESFSSRLVGAYNPERVDVTPGLNDFASDPHTTVFYNYYNASTPTVTGLMSALCSFLPPTGHEEIQTANHLQRTHLLCLPEVLREHGYSYASYITAVEKDFAHKDTIFGSMGTDEVYGTEELKQYIQGEPMSWGWSDHQLFPVTWQMMNNKAKEPFLVMLSTVDTHPPFNLAKDMVKYKEGDNDVLNSFHTTDDAFAKFWQEFKNSKFYNNTILIAVADHAIFPAAYKKSQFPEEAGKLTFYDQNTYMMYIPDSVLPKKVDSIASEIDFTPTLLQVLGIDTANNFEGHSIFDDRSKYPNVLGMHEFGLFINQEDGDKRKTDFIVPANLKCDGQKIGESPEAPLTMCEYMNFFKWKRSMFEQGRFWF